MKRYALLLATLVASLAAQAQVYQYKDASGRMVYTDQPPPGTAKSKVLSSEAASTSGASGNSSAAAPKSAADRELEFKKRQKEQQETARKSEKEAADKAARKEDCARAQKNLQMLESGERITARDDKGERVFLDDSQRAAEADRARKAVADLCK